MNILLILACLMALANSRDFPYRLALTNDGPTLFDTPVILRLQLIPLAKAPKQPPKYYFNWIDKESTFDCPERIVTVNSTALASTYKATYRWKWLRCEGRRLVGVEVFDTPDFFWGDPLARASTTFEMIENIAGNLTSRLCIFDITKIKDALSFPTNYPVAFAAVLHDPSKVLPHKNASFMWTITRVSLPTRDLGPGIIYTFEKPGVYEVAVDISVEISRPPYPHYPHESKTVLMNKTGRFSKTISTLERVFKIEIYPHDNTIEKGELMVMSVSARGSFPLTINWTIEYVHYRGKGAGVVAEGASTLVGNDDVGGAIFESVVEDSEKRNKTCVSSQVPPSLDSETCTATAMSHALTRVGVYRVTFVAANELSHAKKSVYLWVYSTERSYDFAESLIFPVAFIVVAISITLYGYIYYLKRRNWAARSLEVADFEVQYAASEPHFSPRAYLADLWAAYASWVQSVIEPPDGAKRSETLDRSGHRLDGEGPARHIADRSYIQLRSKDELGFSESSITSEDLIVGGARDDGIVEVSADDEILAASYQHSSPERKSPVV